MKQFLFDHTNWGIICVFDHPIPNRARWESSIMRYCILDTNFGTAMPENPEYKDLNNQLIQQNFYQRSLVNGHGGFKRGVENEINELYLEKQRLARLMLPPIRRLLELLNKRTLQNINEHGTPIDDVIAYEVLASKPEEGIYSNGVMEYANTLGITNEQAFTELRLEFETSYAFKIRSYAFMRMFQSKIRKIKTQEDSARVMKEIHDKLFVETQI